MDHKNIVSAKIHPNSYDNEVTNIMKNYCTESFYSYMTAVILQIFVTIQFLFAANPNSEEYFGSITLPLGRVFLQEKSVDNWVKASVHDTVLTNDKLKTLAKSRCEILIKNKMIMRIGEKAIVEINSNNSGSDDVKLEAGKIWVNLFIKKDRDHVTVRTPTSVCAVRGTVYRLNCNQNFTSYRVYKGSVKITPIDEKGSVVSDTSVIVNAGEELILARDFEEYKKQQQDAFNKYLEEQQFGFDEYARQQDEYFREFQRKENDAFKKFKSLNIAHEKFDKKKDGNNNWVKWNNERDRLLQE